MALQSTVFGRAPIPPAGYPNTLRKGYPAARLLHTGTQSTVAAADFVGEISPGATTTIYLAELYAPTHFVTTGAAPFNGGASGSASVSVALFDVTGNILLSAAATALTSATDNFQRMAWTREFLSVPGTATTVVGPQLLPPGTYYYGNIVSTTTTVKIQVWAGVGNFGAGTVAGTYATAFITTNLSVIPPTTYTTAEGPVASLY